MIVVPEQALKNDPVLRHMKDMLSFSPKAREMLDQFAEDADEIDEVCLRVEITGRSRNGFQYDLQFIERKDSKEGDHEINVDGMLVFIDPRSAKYIDGTTLDYQETLMGGGFSFDNPNPLWMDDISKAVAEIIESEVNPAVASHGGHVELMGVEDGKAVIVFGGGCQGCGMADVTLKQGVETMIKDNVPSISEVIDATDHMRWRESFLLIKPSLGRRLHRPDRELEERLTALSRKPLLLSALFPWHLRGSSCTGISISIRSLNPSMAINSSGIRVHRVAFRKESSYVKSPSFAFSNQIAGYARYYAILNPIYASTVKGLTTYWFGRDSPKVAILLYSEIVAYYTVNYVEPLETSFGEPFQNSLTEIGVISGRNCISEVNTPSPSP